MEKDQGKKRWKQNGEKTAGEKFDNQKKRHAGSRKVVFKMPSAREKRKSSLMEALNVLEGQGSTEVSS